MKENIRLLLIAAIVSIAVIGTLGSVSADTIYTSHAAATADMLVLTHDVPQWPSTDPLGDFVPSTSALGILRQKSLEDANFTYNATYDNATGNFVITDINGHAAGAGYSWRPYVTTKYSNKIYAGNVMTQMSGSRQAIYLLTSTSADYTTDMAYAKDVVYLYMDIIPTAYNVTGNVTVSSGSTALDVLDAAVAQGLISSYNATWVPDYYDPTTEYAWLVDINGVTARDWTTSGYGYGLVKDGVATDSLDQTVFTANSTYRIFMGASIYGGNYNGTLIGGEYYATGIAESLTLNVKVV